MCHGFIDHRLCKGVVLVTKDVLLSICHPASLLCDVSLTENGATCVSRPYYQMWLTSETDSLKNKL